MNIAELFVNLGIKGAEKTVGALSNVKKGLGEIGHMSLEAKAGILAAAYALEHLMSNSMKTGTGLENFTELTGTSAQTLQQWQYAARQAGISSEELTGNFKAVQSSMSKMLMGEGAPKGLAMIAKATGNFDFKRVRDTAYVLDQMQIAANKLPKDMGNEMLKSMGASEGFIAASRRGVFNSSTMKKAPTYSDREISQLDKVNVAWGNLGHEMEMAMGHFTSKHGMQLVGDLSKVADQVLRLVEAFTTLAEKLKVFQILGKVFEGWSMIFNGATKGVDAITGAINDPKKSKQLQANVSDFLKEVPSVFKAMGEDALGVTPAVAPSKEGLSKIQAAQASRTMESVVPRMAPPQASSKAQTNNVNVTQNFQHDGKDHTKIADSTRKGIHNAVRQLPVGGY